MCFSLRCGIIEKPRKSSLLRSCEPLHGGFVCQRTSCHLLSTGNNNIGNWVFNIGVISSSSPDLVQGIYISAYGGIVSNNIVYNNQCCGICAWHNAQGATISNNLVWGNGYGGIVIGAGDSYATTGAGENFLVTNNIILYNNVVSIGKYNDYTYADYTDSNNLCYGNTDDSYTDQVSEATAAPLIVNPLLVNFQANGTGNYQLSTNSPCIGTGTSLGMPATDINGVVRPAGGPYDIGPYYVTPSQYH